MVKSANGIDIIILRENTPLIAARLEIPKTDTTNTLRLEGSSVVYFARRAPRTPGKSRRPIPNRSSDVRGYICNHFQANPRSLGQAKRQAHLSCLEIFAFISQLSLESRDSF